MIIATVQNTINIYNNNIKKHRQYLSKGKQEQQVSRIEALMKEIEKTADRDYFLAISMYAKFLDWEQQFVSPLERIWNFLQQSFRPSLLKISQELVEEKDPEIIVKKISKLLKNCKNDHKLQEHILLKFIEGHNHEEEIIGKLQTTHPNNHSLNKVELLLKKQKLDQYLNNKDFPAALKLVGKLIIKYPTNETFKTLPYRIYIQKLIYYLKTKQLSEAKELIDKLRIINPNGQALIEVQNNLMKKINEGKTQVA